MNIWARNLPEGKNDNLNPCESRGRGESILFGEYFMKIIFRIFDTDSRRAQRTETLLYAHLRAQGIAGRIHQVLDFLEFSRMGIKGLPALELNGMLLCQEQSLSEELLADLCSRLSKRLSKAVSGNAGGLGLHL